MTDPAPDAPVCKRCNGRSSVYGVAPCPDCREYSPDVYGEDREYDAVDFGPVPETDPVVVEALRWEQLNHLKEVGFPSG